MKQNTLYSVWGVIYILCTVLGFIQQRNAAIELAFAVISIVFFIPGVLLLIEAYRKNNKKALLRLRYISLTSLVLTGILLAANFASAGSSSTVLGDVVHYILAIVSTPMFCSGIWFLSIFMWACLFIASFPRILGK